MANFLSCSFKKDNMFYDIHIIHPSEKWPDINTVKKYLINTYNLEPEELKDIIDSWKLED